MSVLNLLAIVSGPSLLMESTHSMTDNQRDHTGIPDNGWCGEGFSFAFHERQLVAVEFDYSSM